MPDDPFYDWMYTGFNIAVGYLNWPAGVTASLVGTLANQPTNVSSDANGPSYRWGGGLVEGAPPCGSHGIYQTADTPKSKDRYGGFALEFVDEAWGAYPNYTTIKLDMMASTPVELNTSSTSIGENELKVGDKYLNSEGEEVKVVDIDMNTTNITEKEIPKIDETAGPIQNRYGEEIISMKRFPATIRSTVISGKIIE